MSVICQTFVQNAWRSDLCSNCFKCLADHSDSRVTRMATPRYMPQATSLYQSRGISSTLKWRLSEPIYERVAKRDFASQTPSKKSKEPERSSRGILVKSSTPHKKVHSRPSVDFASEEALVIGYGGNDYDSDQSPWEMGSDDGSIDLDQLDDTDEDRSITRLTRNNTEFNSSNENLLNSSSKIENSDNCINNKKASLQKEGNEGPGRLNCINNSKNSVQKDKVINILTCNVTHNDIQPEKKLNKYYFSTNIEPLKSYLHNTSPNVHDSSTKDDVKSSYSNLNNVPKNNNDDVKTYLHRSSNANVPSKSQNDDAKSYLHGMKSNNDDAKSYLHGIKSNNDDAKSYLHGIKSNNDDAKSYLHGIKSNNDDDKSYLHGIKSNNDAAKVDNSKRESSGSNNNSDSCRNLLSDDFSPLNTRTYSFVSELHKTNANNIASSDHSSDSDYSTCRLTAGDSTDSESFQDAEEPARILPCPSFLHGNFPKTSQLSHQPSSMDSLDSMDKKYDAGSSTSGDVSNLSDDSDAQEAVTYKPRNARSTPKLSLTAAESKKDVTVRTPPTVEKTTLFKPDIVNSNECGKETEQQVDVVAKSSPKTSNSPTIKTARKPEKNQSPKGETDSHHKDKKAASITIDDINTGSAPNPPVDVNLSNIIAVNGQTVSPKTSPQTERPPPIRSSPPQTKGKSSPKSTKAPLETPLAPVPLVHTPVEKTASDEDEIADYDRSPEAINNRQSKLAALALELELARRDSDAKSAKAPPPPLPPAPPEVKAKCTPRTIYAASPSDNYPTIKKGGGVSCASRLVSLPDVLQQQPQTPEAPQTKPKKSRFSLKKLLKRGKEGSGAFTPTKEANPKAWKKQTFDRSRLSLEIVHPMDLASDASGDSPREDVSAHPSVFRKGYSRARSLSALPQLSGELPDPCALVESRKMDTLPSRKAGTVAERKKNRPSLVRTPSCSALPNRPTVTVTAQERTPPPKPPPPPKGKAMQPPPPPPPHQPRIMKPPSCSPARPPPPKIPEIKSRIESGDSSRVEQRDVDKEYANLGDIRSKLTPKKPERPSAVSAPRDSEKSDLYETLQAVDEEEDHYTYLDEAELKLCQNQDKADATSNVKVNGRPWLDLQTSYAAIAAANYEALAEIITTSLNDGVELFQNGGKTLRWKDFSIEDEDPRHLSWDRTLYTATFRKDKVLLMVTPKQQSGPQQTTRHQVRHPVLASFTDHVPRKDGPPSWSSVYVLRQSRVLSVEQFTREAASDAGRQHIHLRDSCFLLLQLIHTLKGLQAEGVEDVRCDLQRLLVLIASSREDKPPVFVLFPEDKAHLCDHGDDRKTLCQATLSTLCHFLQVEDPESLSTSCRVNGELLSQPVAHTFQAIAKVLAEEKASSLSQAKGLLEYMLWGPVDVKISDQEGADVLEGVLQRWLDLQRAQMVKSTISQMQQKVHFHVYEEYQLVFLLQASVKSLKNVISKL